MKRLTSSQSLEMRASPFKQRTTKPDEFIQTPLYNGWLYETFGFNPTQNNLKCFCFDYDLSETQTVRSVVIVNRYDIFQSQYGYLDENKVFFWSDIRTVGEDNTNSLTQTIKSYYSKILNKDSILTYIDQNWTVIGQYLKKSRLVTRDSRVVYHYLGHSPYDENRNYITISNRESIDKIPFQSFISTLGDKITLVIEENNAGAYITELQNYIQTKNNKLDVVAFCSCATNQEMPFAKYTPVDSFTSCMLSPARSALLYHSRAYYCFSDSSLQPISPLFVNGFSEDKKKFVEEIFQNLTIVLETIVDSMAFRLLPHHLFYKLFRADPVLAKLTCNFILACRVLENFGITPVSYPALPDMSREPEWAIFDLRLDAALTLIQGNDYCCDTGFRNYLSGVSTSVGYVLSAPIISQDPPIELSFLKLLLKDDEYCLSACDSLAIFLNNSQQAIEWTLNFFLFTTLFSVLERGKCSGAVLFCIIKILAYCPLIRNTVVNQLSRAIEKILFPCLQQENELIQKRLSLITLVLVLNDSQQCVRQAIKTRDIIKVAYVPAFPTWSLHLICCIAGSISESDTMSNLLDKVIAVDSKGDQELELCIVSTLSSFITTTTHTGIKHTNFNDMMMRSDIEKRAMQRGLDFSTSLNALIRYEVLILFSKFLAINQSEFYESNDDFYKNLQKFFADCLMDPAPRVKQLADEIDANLSSYSDVSKLSNVVNMYQTALLGNVDQLMTNSDSPLSKQESERIPHSVRRSTSGHHIARVNEMKRMKVAATMNYEREITTNLCIHSSSIYYGDSNGYVAMSDLKDASLLENVKLAEEKLTSVTYLDNGGYPLLLTATDSGNLNAHSILNTFELSFSNSFKLQTEVDTHANTFKFEVDPITSKLFSYHAAKCTSFGVRDLQLSRVLPSIPVPSGYAASVKPISRYPDVVAIAGDNFHLVDLRIGVEPVLSYEMDSPVFDFELINDSFPSFAVSSNETTVSFIDARYESMKTVQLWVRENKTVAFGGCSDTAIAAIGYPNGITCVNLVNGGQKQVPVIPESLFNSKPPNPSFISFTSDRLYFVHEKSNIVVINL